MVHPEVRDGIEEEHGVPAQDGRAVVNGGGGDHEANVRDGNVQRLAGPEDGARGVKVALGAPVLAVLLPAVGPGGDVEEQVPLPPEQLVHDQPEQRNNGRVLEHFSVNAELREEAPLVVRLGARHERHVLLHVAREPVVARVRELPREEGDEKERVRGPPDDAVDALVQREGAVAALVRQDPEARAHEALDEAVDEPRRDAERLVLDLRDVGYRGPGKYRDADDVPREVRKGDPERGLEAVRRDGVADGVDVGVLDGARLLLLRCVLAVLLALLELSMVFMGLAHLGRSGLVSTRRLRDTLRLQLRGRPKPEGNGSHAGCNGGRHGE